jgi:DNA-binding MarR family transcriptional regulator
MLNNSCDAAGMMDLFVRVLNKAATIEKEPVDIGHGVLIYSSEVHLIDMIGRFPDENVSGLASRLGITKGAVSQTAKKLEAKGYLERENPEGDRKTVYLRLTGPGREAFAWHRGYHEAVNRRVLGEITGFDQAEIASCARILLKIERIFDACPAVREEYTLAFRDGAGCRQIDNV